MREAGVLVGRDHQPLYWNVPEARKVIELPDSQTLWEAMWENRLRVFGYAHTHPGEGPIGASMEDLTTFEAVEKGLGRRLVWWILSSSHQMTYIWGGPGRLDYDPYFNAKAVYPWAEELRRLSEY